MAGKHLSNDEFFSRLNDLFDTVRKDGKGSIFLTQKRVYLDPSSNLPTAPPQPQDNPLWDLDLPSPTPILVRATNGKWKAEKADKVKLSTVVAPADLEGFFARYADVAKGGMQALKKRDRSKKKKIKKKGKAAGEGDKKV